MGNLTANMLRGSLTPGRHHDDDGLLLSVTPSGARSWICRVQKMAAAETSDMTLTKICRDAEVDAVPHGFRSSFRDWVSEETDYDGDIAEMALAHTIATPVEAAYRRGNLLQKRRKMMDDWASYCRVDVRKAK